MSIRSIDVELQSAYGSQVWTNPRMEYNLRSLAPSLLPRWTDFAVGSVAVETNPPETSSFLVLHRSLSTPIRSGDNEYIEQDKAMAEEVDPPAAAGIDMGQPAAFSLHLEITSIGYENLVCLSVKGKVRCIVV